MRLQAGPVLWFTDGPRAGGDGRPLTIGIRPEHMLRDGAQLVTLTLELVEPLGSETVLHGTLATGEALTAKLLGAVPAVGGRMPLALDPEQLHVFDAATGRRLDP